MEYAFLQHHLRQHGFTVYPHEMVCGPEGCEPGGKNRLVDVAAKKDGLFYAFEYKSAGDYLLRAVDQIENYRNSFDFVIVVAEVPRYDISTNPKKGIRIQEILKLGAGLWTVKFQKARTNSQKAVLADLMKKISSRAPIEAHEVGTSNKGRLNTQFDMWFWLFYSVMDRRSNAATFVHARDILQEINLFSPIAICKAVEEKGKDEIMKYMANTLRAHGFPLLSDRTMADLAHPRSIIEAAYFLKKFDFDFSKMFDHYLQPHIHKDFSERMKAVTDDLWFGLQKIYGVGPRIASQFIRGMVLKGPWWQLSLIKNYFLEECRFNVEMAAKLGIIREKANFHSDLEKFANDFLYGNRGIISHVLWYLRKSFCKLGDCHECPLFEHCFTYELKWQFDELVAPTQLNPIPGNRKWIETKFLHGTSPHIVTLKKPMSPNQKKLFDFQAEST